MEYVLSLRVCCFNICYRARGHEASRPDVEIVSTNVLARPRRAFDLIRILYQRHGVFSLRKFELTVVHVKFAHLVATYVVAAALTPQERKRGTYGTPQLLNPNAYFV